MTESGSERCDETLVRVRGHPANLRIQRLGKPEKVVDTDAPNRPIMSVTSRPAASVDGGAKKGARAKPF